MAGKRAGKGPGILLLGVLAFALLGGAQVALTGMQLPPPTFEELVSWVELLRSRQEVLTADVSDFKTEVADATSTLRAEIASEDALVRADVSAIAVPVGGVIAWWGDLGSIPDNFELCDGNPPTTPGAVFSAAKPDLRSRFIRGARTAVGATGGRDTIESATTDPHTLTLEEMPAHDHVPDSLPSDPPSWTVFDRLMMVNDLDTPEGKNNTMNTPDEPNIITSRRIKMEGGGQPHSHSISGHDNRPRYYELLYIIRVK